MGSFDFIEYRAIDIGEFIVDLARGIFETFDALDNQSREINGIDIFFFIVLNEKTRIHVYDSMRHLDFVKCLNNSFVSSPLFYSSSKSRLFAISLT